MTTLIDRPTRPATRSYRRLSPAEWASLFALYATGGATLGELAEQFSVSVRSIQNHLAASGTIKGSAAEEVVEAAKQHVLARALPTATDLADRIRETKALAYADATAIQCLIRQALEDATSVGSKLSAPAKMRVCDQAAHALDRLDKIRRRVLGLDRENHGMDVELPELPISVIPDSEVEEMRAGQLADDAALGGRDYEFSGKWEMEGEHDDLVQEG